MKVLLTAEEVAAALQVSRRWVVDHSTGKRGPKIPYRKCGKALRYDADEIAAFQKSLSIAR